MGAASHSHRPSCIGAPRRTRRRVLGSLSAWPMGMLVGACSRTPDIIRIGIGQPLSGPLASLGQDFANGATLAVEDINAQGGISIDGKKVRLDLVLGDDRADAGSAAQVARALVERDVVAVIAHLNSGVSIAAAPVYAAAGVPQISASSKTEFTQLGFQTTLRLIANDDLQARAMGSYAAQLPGASRFAVVDDGTPFGRGLADGAAAVLVRAGKAVEVRQSLDDKTTEFTPLIHQLRTARIDALVTTLNDFQAAALVEQLGAAGLTDIVVVGGDTLKTDKLPTLPSRIRAIYATSAIVEPQEFLGGKRFVAAFRHRFGSDPVFGAHYAYDAVFLVADALMRNGTVDKARLLSTLKSFDGNCPVTNSIRFSATGEQRFGAIAVYRVRSGTWELQARSSNW